MVGDVARVIEMIDSFVDCVDVSKHVQFQYLYQHIGRQQTQTQAKIVG